jgi:hypothetical protein
LADQPSYKWRVVTEINAFPWPAHFFLRGSLLLIFMSWVCCCFLGKEHMGANLVRKPTSEVHKYLVKPCKKPTSDWHTQLYAKGHL